MKFKKKFCFILSLLMVLSGFSYSAMSEELSLEDKVNQIFETRSELVSLEKYEEANSLDVELEALGVLKLEPYEVKNLFSTNTRIDRPVANNVNWYLSTQELSYPGAGLFTVQTLRAEPNNLSSNLKESGNMSIAPAKNWLVATTNVVEVFVTDSIKNNIVNNILTAYDAMKGFISGLETTTVLSSDSTLYSYSHVTSVSFKFVKRKTEPDTAFRLCYTTTRGTTTVGYQMPTYYYVNGDAKPKIIQGQRIINAIPPTYDDTYYALKAFNDYSASTSDFVEKVDMKMKINGVTKQIGTIYPLEPSGISAVF